METTPDAARDEPTPTPKTDERQSLEAQTWRLYGGDLTDGAPLRDLILASWQRSAAAGLARRATPVFRRLSDATLESTLRANAELLDVARPHLEWVSAYLAGVDHVVFLADRHGVVLYSIGDLAQQQLLCLSPGYDWSERSVGTNGSGTAIAAGRPVAVIGAEHFCTELAGWTCTAAPVRRDGEVIGAIDISTSNEEATPDRLALVAHVAFVIERELALQHAAREREILRETSARKQRFIAALAHELRRPLSAVMAAAEALQNAAVEPEHIESATGIITRQTQHIGNLVEQLLDASRMQTHGVALCRVDVELGAVLAQAVEACRPLIEGHEQRLEVSLPDAPVRLNGDPTRLTQVFVNLLDNASRYSDRGKPIRVALWRAEGEAVVAVRDEGRGIERELLPKVFELLFQADAERSAGGLGIGLSLVRGIVEAHGGRVDARSDGPGHGAELIVRLPL